MLPITRDSIFPFLSLRDWLNGDITDSVALGDSMPRVNITEDEKQYCIAIAAPGMKKDDFSIDIANRQLTVQGTHEEETQEDAKENAPQFLRHEFHYSSFSRSFSLPEEVDEEAIHANYTDGILSVNLPKRVKNPAEEKRSIRIK